MSANWSRRMLDVGDRLAGFEVESFVARGGMAVVYRARDLSLDRTVALKVIAPELASNDKFRQRFMRESELAASIDHPNIIPIYAAGEEDQLLYLVMRYVPGEDLGSVIKERGVLRPREVLPLFTQLAGALDAAHARQLVHRDVKPGNVLLSGDDDLAQRHVYLSDFGLTKRLSSLTGFTTAGHFLGTIQYVAPEQVANRTVDHRTDIYSLGCVLYEALAGEPPFVREDDAALLWSHVSQEAPPISSRRADLPKALDPIFARTLAKNPDERPKNCRTLVSELRQAFRSPDRPTASPRSAGAAPASTRSAAWPTPTPVLPAAPSARSRARPESLKPAPPTRTETSAIGRRDAVRDGDVGRRRTPGRKVRITAGVVAFAVLATFVIWVWSWQTYSGRYTEAAVKLEHPRSWQPRLHEGQFAVFSRSDLTSVFTPKSNWSKAREVAEADPDKLVGAYVSTAGWLNLNALNPLDVQVKRKFSTFARVEATVLQPRGAPEDSVGLVGTMTALDGGAPTLYFEFIALKSGNKQGVVVVFCHEDNKKENARKFKRIMKSAELP